MVDAYPAAVVTVTLPESPPWGIRVGLGVRQARDATVGFFTRLARDAALRAADWF